MADISSITSGIANSGGTSVQSQDKELGKEEFLTLMVEQLKNQDPMNPQDATEFTSQLAQYTSLEQLININSSIEDMGSGTAEMQRLSALSMIGTEVVSKGSEFTFTGEPTKLGYNMDEEAEQGVLYIRDNSGNTVAAKPLTQTSEGQHMLEWDGVG
ncbi:MAG: flagellar hook capping FlgD N-terminal domain-containing protein, partial [Desulfuromonadaceae bacterium]